MARKNNIKAGNKERRNVKMNYLYIIALAVLLFYASAVIDEGVRSAFENVKFLPLDLFFSILTNFGIVLALFLGIPSLMLYKKDKKAVYFIFLAFVSAFFLSFILKLIALRQRPAEVLYYPLVKIINYSFPSMHSMVVFALLPLLVYFIPRQKYFWIILAFLIAFTRIYFNFHYLSDVVFGIIVGYLIGEIFLKLYKKRVYGKAE